MKTILPRQRALRSTNFHPGEASSTEEGSRTSVQTPRKKPRLLVVKVVGDFQKIGSSGGSGAETATAGDAAENVDGEDDETSPYLVAMLPPTNTPPLVSPAKSTNSITKQRSSSRVRATPQRLFDPVVLTDKSHFDSKRNNSVNSHPVSIVGNSTIRRGDNLCKKFNDNKYYRGYVKSGPNRKDGGIPCWRVRYYEDDDEEDLVKDEVLDYIEFETARKALCHKMGVTQDEVLVALETMQKEKKIKRSKQQQQHQQQLRGRPHYGLNEAMQLIHKAKQGHNNNSNIPAIQDNQPQQQQGFSRFEAKIGLKIRKNFLGASYNGTVISGPTWLKDDEEGDDIKVWRVKYEDDDEDDMEYHELFRWRANRPIDNFFVSGSGGRRRRCRQLCALELFGGLGIVTQAFQDRRFRVQSIDIIDSSSSFDHQSSSSSACSNATINADIMQLDYDQHIMMVPDFIWASPPCETYSTLAGAYTS